MEAAGNYKVRAEVMDKLEDEESVQVQKIAEALKKEEIQGWIEEDYIETAKSLYKAGVRFNG